MSSEKRAYNPA